MSQIFNRSSHPVEVKRINVRIWTLRDEIEAALHRRIRECEAAGIPLNIDDIKAYYGLATDAPLAGQPQLKLVSESVDDVMAALGPAADEAAAVKAAPEEAPPEEAPAPVEAAPDNAAESTAAEGGEKPKADDSISAADKILEEQDDATKSKGPSLELQRPFERQAPDSDRISYGFALLNDLNMDWSLVFSKNSFMYGQSVTIEFLIPNSFMTGAEVMACQHYAMRSRIISSTKPDYRLQCRFTFKISGERTRLREFLTSVTPNLPAPPKKAKKSSDDEVQA